MANILTRVLLCEVIFIDNSINYKYILIVFFLLE